MDNEPANLASVAAIDAHDEILLLHADTIFNSRARLLPYRSISGRAYDITDVARENALPRHVQFVWQGVKEEANQRQFLASDIQ